jgi:hypothetical protein
MTHGSTPVIDALSSSVADLHLDMVVAESSCPDGFPMG